MSITPPDRLVYMANQISRFFASQPGDPAKAAATHLHDFWAPSMRSEIIALLDAGAQDLDPVAAQAVALLKASRDKTNVVP